MKDKLNFVEFFAGSAEISQIAKSKGMNTFSIDWKQYGNIDLVKDVERVEISDVPFVPDFGWFSPDCTTYTISAISTHRNGQQPKTEYAEKCDRVNIHFISLINNWLEINPNFVFFIENPRGMLRHMDFMKEFKRETVWFCQYGDERAKPTDIWTNCQKWIPKPMCRNYKYDKNGNVIDKHCHHESARRGARTGTQGRKGSFERSRIPENLIIEIINSQNAPNDKTV